MNITSDEVIDVVALALDVDAGALSRETTSDEVPQWDSLGYLRLLMAIEERYGVRIELARMSELNSIARIVDYLNQHGAGDDGGNGRE